MGLIIDNNDMREKYKRIRNQPYFVDKSNIINKFNKLINRDSCYVCITKPRRFGKTSIASLLVTYYSKSIDSKEIFDKLKVSEGLSSVEEEKQKEIKQYEAYQGKYHTLYFDFTPTNVYKTLEDYLASINKDLKKDIKKFYGSKAIKDYDKEIYKNLETIYNEKEEKFVIIIDEWDYILANGLFTPEERKDYIDFLKKLVKDKGYVAFVYMTGILPIAKNLNQSSLNCFKEYSMLNDTEYYEYFGFTEPEVKQLCEENERINKSLNKDVSLNYEDLKNWYNGYKSKNGEKIFNPLSIGYALESNEIENYWTDSGRFDEVKIEINFGIAGVEEDIYQLMKRKEISIELKKFGAENLNNEHENVETENDKNENNDMKKDLYSKMVAYGFLTYCNGKISIPNQELLEKFADSIPETTDFLKELKDTSEAMLKATLNKNTERMCKILKDSHNKKIKAGDKVDHGNLKRVLDYVYFYAGLKYDIHEEENSGDGVADFIFYPLKRNGTNIIMELKTNVSAESAIKQIHEKRYYQKIKEKNYRGKVLLVGINYNKKEKIYDCKVEEYTNVLEIEYKEKQKNKRRIEDESNNMRKKLRSYTKVLEIESKEKEKNKRKNEDNSNNMRKKLRSYTKKNDKKK